MRAGTPQYFTWHRQMSDQQERRPERPLTTAANPRLADRPAMGRAWWIPLGFVIVALLLLLITPVVVNLRVTRMRAELSDRSDAARVLVNDLEAAIATELFARVQVRGTGARAQTDSLHAVAVAKERVDERVLDSLVRLISPEAVARFTELKTIERQWRRKYPADTAAASVARDVARAPQVMQAAERLDDYLERRATAIRRRVQRLESFSVASAVVLVPIALLSVLVVFWAGGRAQTFAREMARDRAALARSTDARAALMRGVTHDVKNPLGAAAGYAELLEDGIAGELSHEQLEMVRRIRRLVGVSLDTISELLELARTESGAISVDLQDTDVAGLVRQIADDYRGAAQERRLALHTGLPDGQVVVRTDAVRVHRIVSNLLSNALKYTPAGGRVSLRVAPHGANGGPRRLAIEVADTGPGVPSHLRDRIFEDFFRVPSAESTAQGSGIGLAISRRLARLLGGDITVDSAPGGGAVFTFWLPADGAGPRSG